MSTTGTNMNFIQWPYQLRKGHTNNPAEGACAMDAINWLVHGKHGHAPECASPAITNYVIPGNDGMPNDVRQRMLPYLHRIAGSHSDEHEAARVRILWLGAVRIFAPRALDAARRHYAAKTLRALFDDVTPEMATDVAIWAASDVPTGAAAAWAASRAANAARAANDARTAARAVGAAACDAVRAEWETRATAKCAATATTADQNWDDYFTVLDAALCAGPQGEPWSADVVAKGVAAFDRAKALAQP